MDKRVKFSLKEKILTVRAITTQRESCKSAARKLGCSKSTVKGWLWRYQQHGVDGLKLRNGSYSGVFKVEVIRYMLKNSLSLARTAAYFGIPSLSVIYDWWKIYESKGAPGLLPETRSRKKSLMPKKKKTTKEKASNSDQSAEKLAALQKEVEYLRAENAFLKKLDALIQQEKAAKIPSKRQKPSGN